MKEYSEVILLTVTTVAVTGVLFIMLTQLLLPPSRAY